MTRGPVRDTEGGENKPKRDDPAPTIAAAMSPELARIVMQGTAEVIANVINANPRLRDPIFMVVQRDRGNAFAKTVVATATTMHKHPATAPEGTSPEPAARPVEAAADETKPEDPAAHAVDERRKTAGWEQVARGGINDERHAPSEIRLPASVVSAIERAWQDSLAQNPEHEEGGNLVQTYGGDYKVRRAKGYKDDEFEPDPMDLGWSETMVGSVHTHPYRDEHAKDPKKMPTEYGTVSAPDLDSIVNRDGPLFVVRSGPFTYVIAKSKQFNKLVEQHDNAGTLSELVAEMEQLSNRIFEATKGNMSDRLEQAIIAVCQAYHLVYYEGKGSDLKRVGGPT